jgi:hypothetical protein
MKCPLCQSPIDGWEYYKVKDELWDRAKLPRGDHVFVCVKCLEDSFEKCGLGDRLTAAHLDPVYPWWTTTHNQGHFDGLVDAIAGRPSNPTLTNYEQGHKLGLRIAANSTESEQEEFLRLAWPHTSSKGSQKTPGSLSLNRVPLPINMLAVLVGPTARRRRLVLLRSGKSDTNLTQYLTRKPNPKEIQIPPMKSSLRCKTRGSDPSVM